MVNYAPALIKDGMIVVTNEGIKCYQAGKDENTNQKSPQKAKASTVKNDELVIHGLKLGDSPEQVVKAIGLPDKKGVDAKLNAVLYEFMFVKDKLVAIKSSDEEFKTKKGVQLGSQLEEVLNIYQGYGEASAEAWHLFKTVIYC